MGTFSIYGKLCSSILHAREGSGAMTRKRACSVDRLFELVVGLHLVGVGLEDSHTEDLEGNEHNDHGAKDDVEVGVEAILTGLMSEVIAASAESTNECL